MKIKVSSIDDMQIRNVEEREREREKICDKCTFYIYCLICILAILYLVALIVLIIYVFYYEKE